MGGPTVRAGVVNVRPPAQQRPLSRQLPRRQAPPEPLRESVPQQLRSGHGPYCDQRGLTASTQVAAIFPALMVLMLGLIQAGIWLHARNVAAQAANAAADVARSYQGAYGGTAEPRRTAARIARVGGLEDVAIQISRTQSSVQVTLVARAPLIFDIGLGPLRETATAPVERVTKP
jgi:TadE-like protein